MRITPPPTGKKSKRMAIYIWHYKMPPEISRASSSVKYQQSRSGVQSAKPVFGWTRTRFPLHIQSTRKLTINDAPVVTVIGKPFWDIGHALKDDQIDESDWPTTPFGRSILSWDCPFNERRSAGSAYLLKRSLCPLRLPDFRHNHAPCVITDSDI